MTDSMEQTPSPHTLQALAHHKSEGMRLAFRARLVALAAILIMLPIVFPDLSVIYYMAFAGLFALNGWMQVRAATVEQSRLEVILLAMDLILLAKIVRMEADIRTAQTELDEVGMMVENKRGTPIPNPLLSVIDTLERRQLAVICSMSLNQTASDPRTLNGFAKLETKARSAIAKVGADDLIARPQ